MPVTIQRFLKTKDREGNEVTVGNDEPMPVLFEGTAEGGAKVLIIREEPCTAVARVTVICDGPSCAGRNGEKPTLITWGEDPENGAPPVARDVLDLHVFDGRKFVFCSDGCLVDFVKKGLHKEKPEPPKAVSNVVNLAEFKAEHCVRKMDKPGGTA